MHTIDKFDLPFRKTPFRIYSEVDNEKQINTQRLRAAWKLLRSFIPTENNMAMPLYQETTLESFA